jgi:hypothetical protein
MKNSRLTFLLIIILGLSNNIYAGDDREVCIKFNLDLVGNHKLSANSLEENTDVKTGFSVSFEFLLRPNDYILWGLGGTAQFRRGLDIISKSANFNFIAIYGIFKINIKKEANVIPQIVGHLGYNILTGNSGYSEDLAVNGEVYLGIGINFEINKVFNIEVLYKVNEEKANSTEDNNDTVYNISYSYFSLSWGVYLN